MASAAPILRDVSLDDDTPRSGLLTGTLMRARLALRGHHNYALLRGTLMRARLALRGHHKYALRSSEARHG